jgi:hypothetical protein
MFDCSADPGIVRSFGKSGLGGADSGCRAVPLYVEGRQSIKRFRPDCSWRRCFHKPHKQILGAIECTGVNVVTRSKKHSSAGILRVPDRSQPGSTLCE